MLYGIQSEHLEETAALDGLFARLVDKTAGAPLDYRAKDAFQIAIKPVVDRRKAEELLSKITIHDFRTEPSTDPKVNFKSKIRVQFKNNTGQLIDISCPIWAADIADVPLQVPPHNNNVLQVETSTGWHKNAWTDAAATISVPQGAVFRLWFGLHQAFAADDLRRRHEGQLLGTL